MKSLYQKNLGYDDGLLSRFCAKVCMNNCEKEATSKELIRSKTEYDKFLAKEIGYKKDRIACSKKAKDSKRYANALKKFEKGKALTTKQQERLTTVLTPKEVNCLTEDIGKLEEARIILNHPTEGVKTNTALDELKYCFGHIDQVRDQATSNVGVNIRSSLLEMEITHQCDLDNSRFCEGDITPREEEKAKKETENLARKEEQSGTKKEDNSSVASNNTNKARVSSESFKERKITVYETAEGEVDVLSTTSADILAAYPAGRQTIKAMIEKHVKLNPEYEQVFTTTDAFNNSPFDSGNVISKDIPKDAEFKLTNEEAALKKVALFREKTSQFYDKASQLAAIYPNVTTENLWDGGKVLTFIDYSGSRTPNNDKVKATKYTVMLNGDGRISLKQNQDFVGNFAQEWTNNDNFTFALEEVENSDSESIGTMKTSEKGPWLDGRNDAAGEFSINSDFKIKGNKNPYHNTRNGESYVLSKLADFEEAFGRAKKYSGAELDHQLV